MELFHGNGDRRNNLELLSYLLPFSLGDLLRVVRGSLLSTVGVSILQCLGPPEVPTPGQVFFSLFT